MKGAPKKMKRSSRLLMIICISLCSSRHIVRCFSFHVTSENDNKIEASFDATANSPRASSWSSNAPRMKQDGDQVNLGKHQRYPVHTLLLCRHGDSIWNGGQPGVPETFTGWTDVPLSPKGIGEAQCLGQELVQRWGSGVDACFTSTLQRAQMTAHYCYWAFEAMPKDRGINKFVVDYRLNERHYGSLQGYSKEEIESGKYGHGSSTVQLWRRSWHACPPLLSHDDPRRKRELITFSNSCGSDEQNVPRGESLEQVANNRIRPFIQEVLIPTLNKSTRVGGGTGLIVAHANSLRALIGVFAEVENDPVALKTLERMKLPTGAPLLLRYQSLPDGSFRVCGLDGTPIERMGEESSPKDQQPDLPVWPLGLISK